VRLVRSTVAGWPLASKPVVSKLRVMKFFVLSGSHRKEAQTLKVARYIESALPQEIPGAEVHLYSLSGNPLPLWDEEFGGAPDALWDPISAELKSADALVVVTPEWSGMATPGVKNFLRNCTNPDSS
jgi:NAD(P)H-dependent FMN reductase